MAGLAKPRGRQAGRHGAKWAGLATRSRQASRQADCALTWITPRDARLEIIRARRADGALTRRLRACPPCKQASHQAVG